MVGSIIQLEAITVLSVLKWLVRSGASSIRLTLTFNEHCIFLDGQHRPMAISRQSFERLLAIVEQFPGYFAGLMLTCQSWVAPFWLMITIRRPSCISQWNWLLCKKTLPFDGFEQVKAGIVKWPMSVLRLTSDSKEDLTNLADKILQEWRQYSDPGCRFWQNRRDTASHHYTDCP